MNLMLAAGLLDGPWIVLVFVILSAIANWLSKRREKKELGEDETPALPPGPRKPQSEVNLDEIMRRLMGQESTSHPAPPPPQRAPERRAQVLEEYEEGPTRRSWQEKLLPVTPPVISISPPLIVESPEVHVSNAQLQRAYEQAHRSDQ
ncbi:MAG: hypothetical protein H7Y43_02465, partial [Akkermansiaceae bacterium]|nr:hypothetical protein [Verrucomicrobiales bacterium]